MSRAMNWEKAARDQRAREHDTERALPASVWRQLRTRFPSVCETCGRVTEKGKLIWWRPHPDGASKGQARCMAHGPRGKGKAVVSKQKRGLPQPGADGVVRLLDDPQLVARRRKAERKRRRAER